MARSRRAEFFLLIFAPSTYFKYDFIPFTFCQWASFWKLRTGNIILSAVPVKLSIEFCMNHNDDDDDDDDYDGFSLYQRISNTIITMGRPIKYDDGDDNDDDQNDDDDDDYYDDDEV